jgi:large subunit ribosomal protein L3
MVKGILGVKVGMTQVYDESGRAIPVTVVQAGPCHVLQLRTIERDGYEAVQLGFLNKKRPRGKRIRASQASRSERGHVANIGSKRAKRRSAAGVSLPPKAGCEPKKFVRELRGPVEGVQVGQQVTVDAWPRSSRSM